MELFFCFVVVFVPGFFGWLMGRFLTKVSLAILMTLWLVFMLTVPKTSYESFGFVIMLTYWLAGAVMFITAWIMQLTEEGEEVVRKIAGMFFK